MLVRDILARNVRIYPERIALVAGDEKVTYRELSRRARSRAAWVRGIGVARGDRVAVLFRNSPAYVDLLFAVTSLGAVMVPLNDLLIGRELEAILRDSEARALLYAAEFEGVVDGIRGALPDVHFARVDGEPPPGDAVAGDPPLLSEGDIALQVYTSGPSGVPKGAMLSHRNLIAASASAALELRLSRNDIYLSCTPLPFMSGTGRMLRFLYVGATIVLHRDFDPEEVLRTVERGGITHVLLTPTMIAHLLDLPSAGRFRLDSLRLVLYGGASIPIELLKRAVTFFGCRMAQSYGQVESSGVLTFLHPEDHCIDGHTPNVRRLMSVGQEAIGVEVRVVDGKGKDISQLQVGEVIARGPNIFEGYYRDPSFTAEAIRDGWLYTGDVASMDEDGYILIVDRKRDLLVTGGIPVYPREIENIIAEHPGVMEVAVIGRSDYTWGEIPVAIVVPREKVGADQETLLAHCRANMAPFKVPRAIEFISSLPRNSQGKVLKASLRDKAAGRRRR